MNDEEIKEIKEIKETMNKIFIAVRDLNVKHFEDSKDELDRILFQSDDIPELVFTFLKKILNLPEFYELNESWEILHRFEFYSEIITKNQKDELLEILESSYLKFQEWMGCFVITELLGNMYADEEAFKTLCRLKKIEDDEKRSCIPHGLAELIENTQDLDLRRRAYKALLGMQSDKSKHVLCEVKDWLATLKYRKIEIPKK